jgi:uncharacterized membrane-anchored protein YitT (DUF2179 family)
MSTKLKTEFINYTLILLGSLIMAYGIIAFLSPNKVATGGTAGLAIVFNAITQLSISSLMILINLPLILVSIPS